MRAFLLLLTVSIAAAADWPQWRGIHRDGKSPETGLLDSWPEGGPRRLWLASGLGEGFSSFAVVQGRIYTQGQRGNQEFVIALDAANGKKIWETPAGNEFRERRGHGPRATPTVDGSRLYALSADGTLVCLNLADGKPIWKVNILDKFGGSVPHWGISESPLIDGEKVIVTPGGSDAAMVALNKSNGNVIWKSPRGGGAAYSSPIVVDSGGVRQYVTLLDNGAAGFSASTGERLWSYEKVANRTANIATPVHQDGHIYVSTDYGTGGGLLKVAARSGKATEVYFNRDMRNHYSTTILIGDYLYGFSSQILTAMNFRTGEVAWRDRSVGKGQLIFADGKLYAFSENGQVGLIEATPEAYREISRFSIPQGEFNTWAVPAIADGKLYLREQDKLYCFDIRKR